jgi:hypothetical protein
MSESKAAATDTIPLDKLSVADYKVARASGATTTIAKEDLDDKKPPEVDGTESMKEFKEKREEQETKDPERKVKGGFQKRIDRLTREKFILAERLARYEPDGALESRVFEEIAQRKANGNGATPQEQSRESSSTESAEQNTNKTPATEDPKIAAFKQRYSDWDEVQNKARSLSISHEAAKTMKSMPNAGHISYILAKYDEFRDELNKMSPAQQVQQIRRMDSDIESVESGVAPLAESKWRW